MKASPVFALAAIGIATLGLTPASGQAAPDPQTPAPRQVQVKVEWVTTAPDTPAPDAIKFFATNPWIKSLQPTTPESVTPISTQSLTLTATEDQKVTGGLQQGAPSQESESLSALAHVNADQTITIHLTISQTEAHDSRQTLTTIRTFKPGDRVVLGGLKDNAGNEQIFATASLVKPSDDH